MNSRYLRAATFHGYGITMYVGIGIGIPVIDEEMVEFLRVSDEDIYTEIYDYSVARRSKPSYGKVSYQQLRSGSVNIKGKKILTGSLSSYSAAREIAQLLKQWIIEGTFTLTNPVTFLPSEEKINPLNVISREEI